jgi:type II secretory pathway pseudopilin PulG
VEYLAELLESNPENAFLLIKGALSQVGQKIALEENLEKQPVTKLVLLVDQFEEIFTTEDLTPKNRESLVAVLRSLANSGLVWVIATMRSDFFHRCDEIPALVELKSGLGQYQLVPPSPAEISQIIRKPAQIAGLRFEVDSKTGEQLDDLLRDAAVRNPASLPLLEFCLDELYQRRSDQNVLTLESYKEMGGVEGALAQRAEEAFGRVSPDAQNQFDTVFRQLVTVTPGEESSVTRRTEPLETFSAQPGQKELVDALTKDRLLVSGANDAGQPVVSVAHEALLRSWPRLHSWIESSMEFFRERFRLEYSLNRWRDEGQTDELLLREGKPLASAEALVNQWRDYLKAEEIDYVERSAAYHHARAQRRIRRLQVTIAGVAVLAILAAISSIFAFQQQREAVAAAEEAEKQKTLAEDAAEEARRQEGIAKAQTLKSQETTLQILEGNFRLAFENKDYDSALNWLEEAKTTARQVGRPTETYEIWQATLLPRVNQVEWEIPFAARFNCVVTSGDGSETFFLVNDQFYRLFFEGDGSPRVEALQFDHRVRTVDSFVVDHRNRRLIYSDEEQLFAYAFEAGGEAVQLMDGLNGGIFMTEDQEAIWFVRNLNLEIWSPDMETRLASYPYPHVENGYVISVSLIVRKTN